MTEWDLAPGAECTTAELRAWATEAAEGGRSILRLVRRGLPQGAEEDAKRRKWLALALLRDCQAVEACAPRHLPEVASLGRQIDDADLVLVNTWAQFRGDVTEAVREARRVAEKGKGAPVRGDPRAMGGSRSS